MMPYWMSRLPNRPIKIETIKPDIKQVDWNGGEATPAGTARCLRLQAQAVPAESVRPGMEINPMLEGGTKLLTILQ